VLNRDFVKVVQDNGLVHGKVNKCVCFAEGFKTKRAFLIRDIVSISSKVMLLFLK
jgi:hypothetical protein